MADERRKRTNAKSNFTRKYDILDQLINDSAQSFLVTEQYEKMKTCFNKLEETHDEFIDKSDIDIETDADGIKFIEDQQIKYNEILKRYSAYLKTSEDSERTQLKQQEVNDRAAEKAADA